jgi:hypothetical protein
MRVFARFAGATLVLGGLPFALYLGGRLLGRVPAPSGWYRLTEMGTVTPNHGPWYDTWPGLLVFLCMAALAVLLLGTLLAGIGAALGRRGRPAVAGHAGLAAAQAGLLAAQAHFLAWLID